MPNGYRLDVDWQGREILVHFANWYTHNSLQPQAVCDTRFRRVLWEWDFKSIFSDIPCKLFVTSMRFSIVYHTWRTFTLHFDINPMDINDDERSIHVITKRRESGERFLNRFRLTSNAIESEIQCQGRVNDSFPYQNRSRIESKI